MSKRTRARKTAKRVLWEVLVPYAHYQVYYVQAVTRGEALRLAQDKGVYDGQVSNSGWSRRVRARRFL